MTVKTKVTTALIVVLLAAGAVLWWWLATADDRAAQKQRDAMLRVCVAVIPAGDPAFDDKLDDCLSKYDATR